MSIQKQSRYNSSQAFLMAEKALKLGQIYVFLQVPSVVQKKKYGFSVKDTYGLELNAKNSQTLKAHNFATA